MFMYPSCTCFTCGIMCTRARRTSHRRRRQQGFCLHCMSQIFKSCDRDSKKQRGRATYHPITAFVFSTTTAVVAVVVSREGTAVVVVLEQSWDRGTSPVRLLSIKAYITASQQQHHSSPLPCSQTRRLRATAAVAAAGDGRNIC